MSVVDVFSAVLVKYVTEKVPIKEFSENELIDLRNAAFSLEKEVTAEFHRRLKEDDERM